MIHIIKDNMLLVSFLRLRLSLGLGVYFQRVMEVN